MLLVFDKSEFVLEGR